MFHLCAFNGTASNTTNADLTAAADSEISQRNGHYILTEAYKLLAAFSSGLLITTSSIVAPLFNAFTRQNIYPLNISASVQSPPRVMFNQPYMPDLPQNEEIAVNTTQTGSSTMTTFLWLATADWNANLPRGIGPVPVMCVRVTVAPTTILNTWSALSALTFEQSLRGGTYAVVGAQMQATGLLAFRLVFPRAPMYHNRKLRPGYLACQANGDVPVLTGSDGPFWAGQAGRFSTFEPPQVEFWASSSGALTVEGRLWLVRISEDANVVY